MDSTVYTAAAQKALIGGVNDAFNVQFCDIPFFDIDVTLDWRRPAFGQDSLYHILWKEERIAPRIDDCANDAFFIKDRREE